jgi:hypothetical protein
LDAKAAASRFSQSITAREVVSIIKDSPEELVIEDKAPSTAPVLVFYNFTIFFAIFNASLVLPTLNRAPAYNERKYGSFVEIAIEARFLNSLLN